jgi:hypothetical protein
LEGGNSFLPDFFSKNDLIRVKNSPNRKKQYSGWWDLKKRKGKIFLSKDYNDFHVINFFFSHVFGSQLIREGGLLIHSSSLIIKNQSFLFVGKPGVGKSTILKIAKNYQTLGDDTSVIEKINGEYKHFPSPFHSENYVLPVLGKNYPPRAIFIIRKSSEDKLIPISPKKALLNLMTQIRFLPTDEEIQVSPGVRVSFLPKTFLDLLLEPCWAFLNKTPAYCLYFTKTPKFLSLIDKEFFK